LPILEKVPSVTLRRLAEIIEEAAFSPKVSDTIID